MTEKQISFSGLNLTPYSDISPDGQLSASVGLEIHDGSIRPSVLAGEKYILPQSHNSAKLLYIHSATSYSHFIFQDGLSLYWADVNNKGELSLTLLDESIPASSLLSVGNTLVAFAEDGMHYFLWKNGNYKYLGQKPPEPLLVFSLHSTVRRSGEFELYKKEQMWINGDKWQIKDEYVQGISTKVHAEINKYIAEQQEDGYFIFPFFVRYAYRLYDGSVIMQSAPVLMLPNDSGAPVVVSKIERLSQVIFTGIGYISSFCSWLSYACANNDKEAIQEWGDIIKGVDIFISSQFYTFYTDGEIDMSQSLLKDLPQGKSNTYGYIMDDLSEYSYPPRPFSEAYDRKFGNEAAATYAWGMEVRNEFKEEICNASLFYHVKTLELDELSSDIRYLFGAEGDMDHILSNLELRETLTDDYMTHDIIIPDFSTTYNSRLHIANVKRTFFKGFNPMCISQFLGRGDSSVSIYTYIHGSNGDVVVKSNTEVLEQILPVYLFYPDTDAYKMVIVVGSMVFEYPLAEHPTLNGAYFCSLLKNTNESSASVPSVTPLQSEELSNKMFVSEVGNPFYFPLNGVYTIGNGDIYAMCPVTTAISQGQFGQFPMLLFCSDGNYAMSVNSEGFYSTISPIQRDVCLNSRSITQMDSEVLFISSRGVMITNGASIDCISQALQGVFEPVPEEIGTNMEMIDKPPIELIKTAMIAYDYANQRIIFMLKDMDTSFVLSLPENRWNTAVFGRVKSVVNIFPYSYVHIEDRIVRLTDIYDYSSEVINKGIVVTRALKLDTLQLKRLMDMSVQGIFSGKQKMILFASQDGKKWYKIGETQARRVGAIRGRYFKYYRIALETALTAKENISGIRLIYDIMPEKRLR